jgi:hypothetical protein
MVKEIQKVDCHQAASVNVLKASGQPDFKPDSN